MNLKNPLASLALASMLVVPAFAAPKTPCCDANKRKAGNKATRCDTQCCASANGAKAAKACTKAVAMRSKRQGSSCCGMPCCDGGACCSSSASRK